MPALGSRAPGWTGKLTPGLTLGATLASRMSGKFDIDNGLSTDGGGVGIPESCGVGLVLEQTADWTLAADVQSISDSTTQHLGSDRSNRRLDVWVIKK